MPHLTIEYTSNVASQHNVEKLVAAIHHAALDFDIAPPAGMRTRAVERDQFLVGDGGDDLGFVAMIARIGPGRDPATKTSFIEAILDRAQEQARSEVAEGAEPEIAIAWSMEVQEIDANFRANRNEVGERLQQRVTTSGSEDGS